MGLPLVAISQGADTARVEKFGEARGIIAIGESAKGWIALGGQTTGILAIGGIARAVIDNLVVERIPEPASLALLPVGTSGLLVVLRRTRSLH